MSLDVHLKLLDCKERPFRSGIFIREDGQTKEISRAEWDERYPSREPVIFTREANDEVYGANITHNLTLMAREAELYHYLWHPEKLNITKAAQLIPGLRIGLAALRADPNRFRQFNPENGWGTYEGLVKFVEKYLAACEEYPDAEVSVSR